MAERPAAEGPIPLSYEAPSRRQGGGSALVSTIAADVLLVLSFSVIPFAGGHGFGFLGLLLVPGSDFDPFTHLLYLGMALMGVAWLLPWRVVSAVVGAAGTVVWVGVWASAIFRVESMGCSLSLSAPFLAVTFWKACLVGAALRRRGRG